MLPPDSKMGIVRSISGVTLALINFRIIQYSDSGWFTCAGYPGSYSNEETLELHFELCLKLLIFRNLETLKRSMTGGSHISSMTIAQVRFYSLALAVQSTHKSMRLLVPFDSITREGIQGRYQRMANAIANLAKKTGTTPFYFSLCAWGWVCGNSLLVLCVDLVNLLIHRTKYGYGVRHRAKAGE